MRESQLTGRLRLRHLLEHTEAVGAEMAEMRPRFERLASSDAAPRVVSSFNLFQTPKPLADRVARMIGPGRILEPSAGLGRLYHAVRALHPDCPITLVEQSPECCAELYRMTEQDRAARLVQGDFLACTAERLGLFDAVLMNPPFKMGTDVRHINHARTLLAPGGRLVSLCAAGPRQRAALQAIAAEWVDLPPRSFAESGTNVDAAIVVFEAD